MAIQVYGLWCEQGKVWAYVVPFAEGRLEFLTEHEAAEASKEWNDREPSRRSGWVWVAKPID